MRYLKSACGIPSSLGMVAGWQCSPMALAPWLRVAALLGTWWGRSTPTSQGKVVSRQILCSVRSQLFSFGGLGQWLESFIATIPAVVLWMATLSWYQHLPWMSQDQFRGERWKKDTMFRHIESCGWSTWDHLSWWPIPRKCFSPGVFLCTLDDHVPGVMLLRATGCACLPLISILSSPETC